VNVIILAAGVGSRLRPITDKMPKCLTQIGGFSLLDTQIACLNKNSLFQINVVGGYLVNKLYEKINITTINNPNYSSTNMVYSLMCAVDKLDQGSIISYGDIAYSPKIIQKLLLSEADVSVVVDKNWHNYWTARMENIVSDVESFSIGNSGFIKDIGRKVRDLSEVEGQYIGLIKISKSFSSIFKSLLSSFFENQYSAETAFMTDFLQYMIRQKVKITPVFIDHDWIEIDTIDDYALEENLRRMLKIQDEIENFP
jgi:L-glutamine-phosphate cytidylyltransferase